MAKDVFLQANIHSDLSWLIYMINGIDCSHGMFFDSLTTKKKRWYFKLKVVVFSDKDLL